MADTDLLKFYQSIDPAVTTIYVFPHILRLSRFNPYLQLLYKPLTDSQSGVRVVSSNSLFPVFLFKKITGEHSIVHYHWPEFSTIGSIFIQTWKICTVLLYRMLGGKLVLTIHNKKPHANRFCHANAFIYRCMARWANRLHVHSPGAVSIMAQYLRTREEKFTVIAHPQYPSHYINRNVSIDFLQSNYGFSLKHTEPIFLSFGYIAAYKGIEEFVEIFSEKKYQCIIAGAVKKGEKTYFKNLLPKIEKAPTIFLKSEFISHDDEKYFFNGCDCILFNGKETLSSGSVILALSYNKPVILPDIASFDHLNGPTLYKFKDSNHLREVIDNAYRNCLQKNHE
ncbi:MAG: glycosyltransferase [Chitinivibrionales bacterium]|nr:glycosyltransferase [Chitinivibrionales bacterium]